MNITKIATKTGIVLKKYSPEILMVAGVGSIVTGTVLACKATLKVEDIQKTHRQRRELIAEAAEDGYIEAPDGNTTEYSEDDKSHDLTITYVQTGMSYVKLYGPAVTFMLVGIGCVLGAHGIMRKRNVALLGLYKAAEETFSAYRKRVVADVGEDKDREYRFGDVFEDVEVITTDKKGNEIVKTEKKPIKGYSQYARFFDETSTAWENNADYNKAFLIGQQNYANDMLRAKGVVFLNEVYDMLGMERTSAGQLVGWVNDDPEQGDGYIDFGIFTKGEEPVVRHFVNGFEKSILLDFNVDGVVYDLL